MPILNEEQIKAGYFHPLLGFPPIINLNTPEAANMVREVKEYKSQEQLCIACTQLPEVEYQESGYTKHERKLMLAQWIDFLQTSKTAFRSFFIVSPLPLRFLLIVFREPTR